MGYSMYIREANFHINKEKVDDALKACHRLMGKVQELGSGGVFGGGKPPVRHFSWVNTSAAIEAETLEDFLYEWRWVIEKDKEGDVANISFHGDKIGDEDHLFKALAPYVKDGSYIRMQGEDGSLWSWSFEDGKLVEKEGTVVWG